ncbi:hypothetical protein, unlikely [Trypanosoma brucei gambiense DAL972]|uniref:Uncharacterized protein n=1 Tax=Trypanosoma brucei gambiense (strain MHOM/CI/86/DAL972) TaxID=679716 RepID=C9ZMK4_TRYB9|nr:hypothetical protein, unlikely [Trypanosoma brucei gambiense DAL972]CBH10507.1 hypothetical protein, unlikely [Trypanosoma brucei gambiense DAL972]|eukprot:XP_011772796.1 hypothetical protein, unlikely [Trypanosoma brucei gambiense DAL972]
MSNNVAVRCSRPISGNELRGCTARASCVMRWMSAVPISCAWIAEPSLLYDVVGSVSTRRFGAHLGCDVIAHIATDRSEFRRVNLLMCGVRSVTILRIGRRTERNVAKRG